LNFARPHLLPMQNHSIEKQPRLLLVPIPIAEVNQADWQGAQYKALLSGCTLFLVENIRTARRYISSLKLGLVIDELHFEVLDKNTERAEILRLANLVKQVENTAVMSESGCPGIADPGSLLVAEAHALGIKCIPLIGPSSIFLALMASGMSGQQFAFHGYLPIDKLERDKRIKFLEKESAERNQTQIFIETPYRNGQVWKALLEHLSAETRLCYAQDITGKDEQIITKKVKDWRKYPDIQWNKHPTIFIFQS